MKKYIPFCLILLICSFSGKQEIISKNQTMQMLLDSLRHKENLVEDSSDIKVYSKIKPNKSFLFGYQYYKKNELKIDFEIDTLINWRSKYLKIGESVFDLKKVYFWRTGKEEDLVYKTIYHVDIESINKFQFAGKAVLPPAPVTVKNREKISNFPI